MSEEQMERLSSESLPRFNGIGDWITTISGVENPVVRDYVVKSYEPGGPFRLCPDGHFLRRVEPAEATRLAMFTGYRPRKSCEWVVCELCGSAWITPNMDYQVCVRCLRLGCECICDSAAEWRKLPDDVRLGNVKHALEAMRISRPGPRALAKEPCWSPEPPKPADPLKHIFGWKGRSELSERRDPGFVYVARAPGRRDNALKIGKARKPENRLKEFRTCIPDMEFVSLFEVPNAGALERALHRYFGKKRVKGEWFDVTIDDIWKAVKEIVPEDVSCIATGR